MRAIDVIRPSEVRKLYRGILQRNPFGSREINSFILDFVRNPNLETRLRAMIYSEEFQLMVLPDLIRAATEEYNGNKTFFIHVPKTAGTSVRIAIAHSMGIPSFNLYPNSTVSLPTNLASLDFWPYWAGHANIEAFPKSHSGFTVFRESRSRLLSAYRQQLKNELETHLNPHDLLPHKRDSQLISKRFKDGFNSWIKEQVTINYYYIPNPNVRQIQPAVAWKNLSRKDVYKLYRDRAGTDDKWRYTVSNMSENEVIDGLKLGMSRLVSASWVHEPKSLIESISNITKNPEVTLTKENYFQRTSNFTIEKITRESLDLLESIRKQDKLVIKVAADLGLITELTSELEDELFEKSLKNLGFKLP